MLKQTAGALLDSGPNAPTHRLYVSEDASLIHAQSHTHMLFPQYILCLSGATRTLVSCSIIQIMFLPPPPPPPII